MCENTIHERDYYMDYRKKTKQLMETIQDFIPLRIRKKAKQWLKKQNDNPADNIVLRGGNWVARKSDHLISRFYPDSPQDFFIHKQAASGKYSFHLPLVIMNPYGYTPLTALAVFTTRRTCRIRCTVPSKEGIKGFSTTSDKQTAHCVPILGLYPDSINTVTLEM